MNVVVAVVSFFCDGFVCLFRTEPIKKKDNLNFLFVSAQLLPRHAAQLCLFLSSCFVVKSGVSYEYEYLHVTARVFPHTHTITAHCAIHIQQKQHTYWMAKEKVTPIWSSALPISKATLFKRAAVQSAIQSNMASPVPVLSS